jgi:hypothetical protein
MAPIRNLLKVLEDLDPTATAFKMYDRCSNVRYRTVFKNHYLCEFYAKIELRTIKGIFLNQKKIIRYFEKFFTFPIDFLFLRMVPMNKSSNYK